MKTPTHPDLLKTAKLPACTMAELVYGPRPTKRAKLPTRLIFVAALATMSVGCAMGPRPVTADVESVGALSASATHVYQTPVHATTDLTPGFQAIEGADDDATETVTTVTRAPDAGEADASETPAPVEKQAHGF